MMPKFHYAKHGQSWGVESVVDDDTYNAARDMFAEALGIPAQSLEYLVQYAVNQTTQDSMAQPVAAAKESGDDVAAAAIAACNKRWDSIRAGTAGVRAGGGRVTDPIESEIRLLADIALKSAAKSKGKKLPKGKDYIVLRDSLIKLHYAAFETQAKERVAKAAELAKLEYGKDFF